MIVCVVGRTRSGKTVLSDWLCEATCFPRVEVSSIVKKITGSTVRKDLQLEKEKQKYKENPDWLYIEVKKEIIRQFLDAVDGHCVVSGIRELHLLKRLQEDFGEKNVVIVAALVDDEVRKKRIMDIDKKSVEEFEADEARDSTLFDTNALIGKAHVTIDMNGSLEATKEKAIALAKTFLDLVRR